MFDFADETFNQLPFPIAPCVIFMRLFSITLRRDYRFSAAGCDFIPKVLRPIASVGNHKIKEQVGNQILCLDDVMTLTGCQMQAQRITQTIHRYMDFGAETTATASQSLFSLSTVFLAAPAAQA